MVRIERSSELRLTLVEDLHPNLGFGSEHERGNQSFVLLRPPLATFSPNFISSNPPRNDMAASNRQLSVDYLAALKQAHSGRSFRLSILLDACSDPDLTTGSSVARYLAPSEHTHRHPRESQGCSG